MGDRSGLILAGGKLPLVESLHRRCHGLPPPELPTVERVDVGDRRGQGSDKERDPATDAETITSFEALRRMYEHELHVFMSSTRAQSNAELRANQAVLECQNQSRTTEAKCELLLAIQGAHSEKVILEIRQRHDALEGVEGHLSAARTAEAALYREAQYGFNSLTSGHADELEELRERAAREVQSSQAEVSVH